jgi:hypothetical protein
MSRQLTRAWLRQMRAGNCEAAWRISDEVLQSRRRTSQRFVHLGREVWWNGEPVAGKRVLIRCSHGLGDTLQFIRYAPLVRKIAARVIVQAQAALCEILRHVDGIDAVETLYNDVAPESYDVVVEAMELPHLLRAVVADVPYIHAQPTFERAPSKLRVGIVWRAGEWDQRRSVPVELIRTVADVPGIVLHIFAAPPP